MIRATDVAIEEGREQERARVFACIDALLTAYREKHGGTGEYGLALGDLRMWMEQPALTCAAIFATPASSSGNAGVPGYTSRGDFDSNSRWSPGPVTSAVDAALAELRRLNGAGRLRPRDWHCVSCGEDTMGCQCASGRNAWEKLIYKANGVVTISVVYTGPSEWEARRNGMRFCSHYAWFSASDAMRAVDAMLAVT